MGLVRIERSGTRCISKETLKKNERFNHGAEDDLLDLWIEASEDLVEARINRAVMRQKLQLDTESVIPRISLPRVGVDGFVKLESASVQDRSGERSIDIDDLRVRFVDMLPQIIVPGVSREASGSVSVTYSVGASKPSEVPAGIRQAVLLIASHWYRSREAISTDSRMRASDTPLPFGAEALISSFRIPNVNSREN